MVLWEQLKKFWKNLFHKEKKAISSPTTTFLNSSFAKMESEKTFIDEMKDKMAQRNASKIETPVYVGDGTGILHHFEY